MMAMDASQRLHPHSTCIALAEETAHQSPKNYLMPGIHREYPTWRPCETELPSSSWEAERPEYVGPTTPISGRSRTRSTIPGSDRAWPAQEPPMGKIHAHSNRIVRPSFSETRLMMSPPPTST
ncbi:hypothetical protein PGTUg99_013135 [Puccinia graminis f. sp. tritici]|uniref:Uncharacterized protein n=1 Tax=Puccinia graminis f. sp. tritici TaxID=56615 RepID=A0A5B0SJR9_PUCGR|nr:hypothetical protein PGTUg99_013135 [Puccinia graminis f. sp. tritici]